MNVLINIFLVVVVLMEWLFKVLVLFVIINGISLYINVKDVIRMGCRWFMEFLMVVLKMFIFCLWYWLVIFIIRMVFLFSRLINIIKVIWV